MLQPPLCCQAQRTDLMNNPNREEALFALAVAKPAAERAAFLDRECANDPALRARLAFNRFEILTAPRRPRSSIFARTYLVRAFPCLIYSGRSALIEKFLWGKTETFFEDAGKMTRVGEVQFCSHLLDQQP